MTEQTLGEAIKIKRQIDHLRERKAEVEKVRAWCKEGNASFKIQTTEAGFSRDGVTISGATTKLVLDKELEEIKLWISKTMNGSGRAGMPRKALWSALGWAA